MNFFLCVIWQTTPSPSTTLCQSIPLSFILPLSFSVLKSPAVAFPGVLTDLQRTFSKMSLKAKINHKAAVYFEAWEQGGVLCVRTSGLTSKTWYESLPPKKWAGTKSRRGFYLNEVGCQHQKVSLSALQMPDTICNTQQAYYVILLCVWLYT